MNKITLKKESTGWIAIYTGPHAAQIEDLFNSTMLPTSFTAQAAPEKVLQAIQKLNPNVAVVLE